MNHSLQIAVLYGGKSTEHEVSVHSAGTVCRTLQADPRYHVLHVFIDKDGYWFLQTACSERTPQDIAITPVVSANGSLYIPSQNKWLRPEVFFPVLHGANGEDGTLQGLLESLQVPYVGCGVLASAMGMDKEISKQVAQTVGVPTLPYQCLNKACGYDHLALEKWAHETGYPIFVKPVRLGSSIGVSKVTAVEQLHQAIEQAFRFDTDVLVEKGLDAPQEVFCGLLGEGTRVRSSECGELKSLASEFFDYQAKYITVGGCETRVPAVLPAQTRAAIRRGSELIFQGLRGSGLARADFLVDKQGKAWFSEMNTMPGMSETSLYPQLFAATGVAYVDILTELIELALQVYQRKNSLFMEHIA
ncbi:MAG: D-alanine--D-alanine ligase [Elusimicrobiaceae bacterium]|nr:D-alanine--D-alanine ligase [Elusimicrobiaceae bacterium]